ncbi:hypothetical protein HDU88_005707 [Geranomyces variabilis]|nr:hypothetical protein HDU88_005707 [Geranomyces variabilis]
MKSWQKALKYASERATKRTFEPVAFAKWYGCSDQAQCASAFMKLLDDLKESNFPQQKPKTRARAVKFVTEMLAVNLQEHASWNEYWTHLLGMRRLTTKTFANQMSQHESASDAITSEITADYSAKRRKLDHRAGDMERNTDAVVHPSPTIASPTRQQESASHHSLNARGGEVPARRPSAPASKRKVYASMVLPTPMTFGDTPHKPKITDNDLEEFENTVMLAMSTTSARATLLAATKARLAEEGKKQARLSSLSEHPATRKAVMQIVLDSDWLDWEERMFSIQLPPDAAPQDRMLWKVVRMGYAACHVAMSPSAKLVRHERTSWIDKIIPWFSPMRITGLIDWKWCEITYAARANDLDATTDYTPRRNNLADGIGSMNHESFEAILMESSGHEDKEQVDHALGDSKKLISNSILALRYVLANNRDATCVVDVDGTYKWEVLELRSAEVPACWKDLKKTTRMAEIVATTFIEMNKQAAVLRRAEEEQCGIITIPDNEPTVRQTLGPNIGLVDLATD